MSIYRWQQPSLIRQVEITGPKQHPVALIEASPGASPQTLQAIPAQLRAQRPQGGLPENGTYRRWHANIRQLLPSVDYPQSPQLDGTSTQKRWQALT